MKSDEIITWAKAEKRVTNKRIRDCWGVSEDAADTIYKMLKAEGIVGTMGHVVRSA